MKIRDNMDEYTKQLENVIMQMLEPIKNVPFKVVLNFLTSKSIINFDSSNPDDKLLLEDIIKVADYCAAQMNAAGIYSRRENEVGNKIEPYIVDGLNHFGLKASKPKNEKGSIKTTGYPDIYFLDKSNRHNYLECKTYSEKNIHTSFRSFYFSPSKMPKIIYDARHFAISYQVQEIEREENENLYKFTAWKILSLENLLVDVKHEFNSDNIRLYDPKLILAEKDL